MSRLGTSDTYDALNHFDWLRFHPPRPPVTPTTSVADNAAAAATNGVNATEGGQKWTTSRRKQLFRALKMLLEVQGFPPRPLMSVLLPLPQRLQGDQRPNRRPLLSPRAWVYPRRQPSHEAQVRTELGHPPQHLRYPSHRRAEPRQRGRERRAKSPPYALSHQRKNRL